MSPTWERYVSLAGRVLLCLIFLLSGLMKIVNWDQVAEQMRAEGMTAVPFFLTGAILVEVLGALALLLGFQTRVAALLLLLYLIPVTLVFHDFWTYTGPAQQNQMVHFLKNLAIMGGLLEFGAVGAGALSLDAYLPRAGLAPVRFGSRVGRPV